MKTCSKCNIEKTDEDFYTRGLRVDGVCKSCVKLRDLKRRDKILAYKSQYRKIHKKELLLKQKQYQKTHKNQILDYIKSNKESISLSHKKYYKLHRQQILKKAKAWRSTDRGKKLRLFNQRKRQAAKLKRVPSYADLDAIRQFYLNCPKGKVVDHIIPLQGAAVSGLHVLKNLQYLTVSQNAKKSNKFPYYPMEFYREKGLIY